jgi:hypothetical protein
VVGTYGANLPGKEPTDEQQEEYWRLTAARTAAREKLDEAIDEHARHTARLEEFLDEHEDTSFLLFRDEDIQLMADPSIKPLFPSGGLLDRLRRLLRRGAG